MPALTQITLFIAASRKRPAARLARVPLVFVAAASLACGLFANVGLDPVPAARAATIQPPSGDAAAQDAARAGRPPGAEGGGAHGPEATREGEGTSAPSESAWAVVARLFNFGILAGALVYLLRSPFVAYLRDRGVAIRADLTKAADLRREASAELEQIERRLGALPGEIETLRSHGAEEIAAEEGRIQESARVDRQRMLDQAKREVDTELRVAVRALKKRAGELAVRVATERVQRTITEQDQGRLIDRYVRQVRQ